MSPNSYASSDQKPPGHMPASGKAPLPLQLVRDRHRASCYWLWRVVALILTMKQKLTT